MDPCTFPVMHTLSIGLYPFRKGLWTPAHFWTWKLCPLTHIPPGRGSRVFIHGSLHISGHGNSVCLPISLQEGAPEFLSMDPCTFPDMETPSIGPYPSREGHQSFYPQILAHFWTWKLHLLARIPPERGTRVFIHGSLHISTHGNSVHWPVSLQGGAPEFLSTDPCTFPDMETPSIGPYPSREGHQNFYPQIPAHFRTWKLRPLARIPPGRGTGVFIHRSLHISRHGTSVHWPVFLQEGHRSFYPQIPAHFQTWKLHP